MNWYNVYHPIRKHLIITFNKMSIWFIHKKKKKKKHSLSLRALKNLI